MLRILVVDDHPVVRLCLRRVVETHADWALCGEAADGVAALELALREAPDVVVLDVTLPRLNGVAVTRQLQRTNPEIRVLLLSAHEDVSIIRAGLAAGARGYLFKSDAADALEGAITALGARRPYFSARVSELLLESVDLPAPQSALERLTRRELEVAQLVTEGRTNKEIARALGITKKTVAAHRAAALRKSGSRNAAQLASFALRHHLVQ
jgi:DNA-binding NarL/FixJ family response regulator